MGEKMPWVARPDIVSCAQCVHCYRLTPVDPMIPHDGTGDPSFYCECFDVEFCAPKFDVNTFYCYRGVNRNREDER